MKKLKHSLHAALFLISTGFVFSQPIKFKKKLEAKQSGIPFIFSIVQDQKGFIWFTSPTKGLQRYDGKKIITYSHNNDNTNSLSNNLAFAAAVDSAGHIWVGTLGSGIDRFDPETKKFTHYLHDPDNANSLGSDTVFVITSDRSGNIWFGTTRTLDKYDPATGKFTHYIIDELFNYVNTSESFPAINAICEDKIGNIWIGWNGPFDKKKDGIGGLARLDKTTGKFIYYKHDPANPNSLSDNNVLAIYEDSKNNLWVCTDGRGLQTLDRATGKFTHYDYYDPAQPEKISRPPFTGRESGYVTFVTEDSKGRLWIGSDNGGINMYNPELKRTTHYGIVSNDKTNRFAKDTLSGFTDSSAVRAISSKDGLLWITGSNGDIYTIDFSTATIPFVSLNAAAGAFYHDANKNTIWILSDSGIIRKNLLTNQQKLFRRELNAFDMKGDDEGNLWIATHDKGIDKFNIKTEQYTTHFRHDKNNPASLVNDAVHVLFFDRQHYLWIGTHNGLSRMDIKTGNCTNFINDPKDSFSIGKTHINSISEDKDGIIWIGTDDDAFSFDIKTGKFKRYKIGNGPLTNLCIDKTGNIWTSNESGLFLFDKQKNGFKKFTSQVFPEGISDVYGLVEDDKGNLWISTNNSIIKLNREQDVLKIYGSAQGVQLTEAMWLKNIMTEDGLLFLGSKKGYYTFNPDELVDERQPPFLNFTSFKIGSKEIIVGEESILTTPVWKTNIIKLSYSQNTFSFEFDAIDYKSLGEIKYFYKLENYADEWRDLGTEPKVTFFNLPHGKYILHIRAVNSEGSVAEKTMVITVTPPWWKTWWAYSLYALLVIIAGYLIYKYQKYYIIRRERERTQQKELAQAKEIEKAYTELKAAQQQLVQSEKMASLGELTAGIAHEIQNPLNFVNNFSEVSKELLDEMKEAIEKGDTEDAKGIMNDVIQNLEKINHHGKRADGIVKGMLQHSRSSSGQKELTDINALCDEYLRLAYHGLRAKDKSFNAKFETHLDETVGKLNVIPQDIGRVVLNLINNAFYAVSERKKLNETGFEPTVTVSTKKEDGNVLITVADNGTGIPQKVLDKIFQPFFTTKPTGQGTGLGLSLSYDIITKGHGGELKVETKEGEGCEFTITLPA